MYFACSVAALGSGWFEESSQDLIPFGPVIVQYLFVVPLEMITVLGQVCGLKIWGGPA